MYFLFFNLNWIIQYKTKSFLDFIKNDPVKDNNEEIKINNSSLDNKNIDNNEITKTNNNSIDNKNIVNNEEIKINENSIDNKNIN